MMRSLYSGVAGLRNHQTKMDVVGNNISNVNTIGFKASRANFQDMLSQTMQGASSPSGNRGGTNPLQIGLGTAVASVDTLFTDGSYQPTGKNSDLAIKGQGFFILQNGDSDVYTRAGSFDFDKKGNYVVPGTGYRVKGWMADSTGVINNQGSMEAITIPVGQMMKASATTNVTYSHNLNASSDVGTSVATSELVYDSLGNSHKLNVNYYKTGTNTWLAGTSVTGITDVDKGLKQLTFNTDGTLASAVDATLPADAMTVKMTGLKVVKNTSYTFTKTVTDASMASHKLTFTVTADAASVNSCKIKEGNTEITTTGTMPGVLTATVGASTMQFDLSDAAIDTTSAAPTATQNLAVTPETTLSPITFTATGAAQSVITYNFDALTQYGQESTVQATDQDGYTAGTLDDTTINSTGVIVGNFTNGQHKDLAQVGMVTFNNPAGLIKSGDSLYMVSNNSGEPQQGVAGSGGRGSLAAGTLEMSNVDLAQQFSDMIITERGFQANSKIISVSDEMLQDLANLKR